MVEEPLPPSWEEAQQIVDLASQRAREFERQRCIEICRQFAERYPTDCDPGDAEMVRLTAACIEQLITNAARIPKC